MSRSLVAWLLVALVGSMLGGCLSGDAVDCGNGFVCPHATVCTAVGDSRGTICATEDQLAPCVGKIDGDPCTIAGIDVARCYDSVCTNGGCGNGRVEGSELCDDGNNASGDTCSADCTSLETCGNRMVDSAVGETCDDGNHLDHDACSSTCQVETLHWFERRLSPPPRALAAMAYDPLRDRVVLFGGFELYASSSETWEWDGAAWVNIHGPSPTARSGAAMAFDGTGLVLFGGDGLADTWRFDGVSWTSLSVTGPVGSTDHSMAYDAKRKRVVLFGGRPLIGDDAFDATWEWDGTGWTRVTTPSHPSARSEARMTYDPVHGVIVLAGGHVPSGTCAGNTDGDCVDTWTYDGATWTEQATSALAPHGAQFEMAFDTASQRVLAFGSGSSGNQVVSWDGTTWTDVTPSSTVFMVPGAATAATRSQIVIQMSGSTWLWEAGAFRQVVAPTGSSENEPFVNDVTRDRAILLHGGATWELSRAGWTQLAASSPVQRSLAAIAFDPIARNAVMFGGDGGGSTLGDTWIWNGVAWTQSTPAQSPSARQGAAMAFDGEHVTMFGGTASPGAPGIAETWSWSGSSWILATPATSPPAVVGATAGYDPIRDEMVLFGAGQTWTYNGVTWTDEAVSVSPGPRSNMQFVWNAAVQRLVLAGGEGAIDTWAWDGERWSQLATTGRPPGRGSAAYAASLDGAGLLLYGGRIGSTSYADLWELRFDGERSEERCDGSDADGDMLVSCADDDCWQSCSPACPPGTSCPAGGPSCGDTICDPVFETCQTCAMDCDCGTLCGDFLCGTGEVCPGDCP
jgi:cysteine-rich repeat protein